MEEKQGSVLRHAMTYGAIIGLILIIYSILLYLMKLTFNTYFGIIQYFILAGGIYLGTKAFRDNFMKGYLSYGKALGMGVLISVFVGIITVFFSFIHMRFIDPGIIDQYIVEMEETLLRRGMTDSQIDLAMETSVKMLTSVWSIPIGVTSFTLYGLVISLITSAFVKREPNPVS